MLNLAILRRAFAALVLAAAPAFAQDLQEASKLHRAGQHQQALERVNKVLAGKPKDPQARFLKGLILTEMGNAKEAMEIFQRLTQDFPELPEPYNNLAVLYASQGQYEKARAALEQSIRTHPSYATAYENLGDVYAKLASQAYDKALQLDSTNTGAQNKLSLVRDLVGGPPAGKEPAKPPVVLAQKPPVAPEKPVAQKPVIEGKAVEKPAAKPASQPVDEVLKTVNSWAEAWSKKDADAYLAHYAKDFRTPKGAARAAWEKERRARIGAPKSISVTIASPQVTMNGDNEATVRFRQHYRSDVIKASSSKTLVLVKADGRWQIREEKAS